MVSRLKTSAKPYHQSPQMVCSGLKPALVLQLLRFRSELIDEPIISKDLYRFDPTFRGDVTAVGCGVES